MPWCHNCEKEYGDGLERCPDCGEPLFEELPPSMQEPAKVGWGRDGDERLLEQWPQDENGEPVKPALLTSVMGNQMDYELTASLLRAFGIPVLREFPQAGRLARLWFGFSGAGMDVYVPETMLQEARDVLESRSEEE